jgi:hypothetical protein
MKVNDRLRAENDRLKRQLEGVEKAHAVLLNREWFAINNPISDSPRTLYFLERDAVTAVFSLGTGDTVLVGRRKK